ncbi:unnamed protein product [Cunninghamella blakesleeana]
MHRPIRQDIDMNRSMINSPLPTPSSSSTSKSILSSSSRDSFHLRNHPPPSSSSNDYQPIFQENHPHHSHHHQHQQHNEHTTTSSSSSQPLTDYPQEVTWLFFRDNQWVPFQSDNHHKIEQAFTFGGIYVDIKDSNFPQLKSIRVFPTRFYLSYLGMKYRLSCVIQG